jgi:ubiquinone/menaquinone biosynthesis C-methylase UbiE
MGVREAYDDWSATYDTDENLTRDLGQAVTRHTVGHARCKSVLEIGCGTGKNTTLLERIGERVWALDFSELMLKRARAKVESDRVVFLVADIAKHWPYPDRCADLVVSTLVLEHVEDLTFGFSEAFRTLVEGGRLFVCELHPFRQYQGERARYRTSRGTVEIPAFVHHLTDYQNAAAAVGFKPTIFREWWHEEDIDQPPRLASFLFEK